jgi:hypothetical protein
MVVSLIYKSMPLPYRWLRREEILSEMSEVIDYEKES